MKISLYNFLKANFEKNRLENQLFYNFEFGLRFNLQSNRVFESNKYFNECIKRSLLIFEEIFEPNNNILIVFNVFQKKRNKIRKSNFILKQIGDFDLKNVKFKKYSIDIDSEKKIFNQVVIQSQTNQINYPNLIEGLINKDFPTRAPRITEELFFINLEKKIIFKIYDDRGLDVVSQSLESLEPIFKKFNEFILEYDRDKIENLFREINN
ncbi:DUF3885 domain-containing protein [Leptospira terpstrae]|uniref:DUF3885 domain-containing protein n=1 Tax=Leptospira terpstrae TaxID=293075 RepID=UPI003D063F17